MSENNRKNPIQVVVSTLVKQEIEDEATRLSRLEKHKVTQGEVVRRGLNALKKQAESGEIANYPVGTSTNTFDSYPKEDIKSHPVALQEQWVKSFARSLLEVVDQYHDKLERLAIDGDAAPNASASDLSSKVSGAVDRSKGVKERADGIAAKHRGNRKPAVGDKERAG